MPDQKSGPVPCDAEYLLETPLKCPRCQQEMSSVQVIRLIRDRVNFVSTLPRRGHVIICPLCKGIISADLGGIASV